jgi:hypothetical protein
MLAQSAETVVDPGYEADGHRISMNHFICLQIYLYTYSYLTFVADKDVRHVSVAFRLWNNAFSASFGE